MFRKFLPFQASSRLEFKDPDSGYIHTGKTLPELYTNIIRYRVQNGYELLEALPEVVDNYLCGLPENCNKCTGIEVKELNRSFQQYIKGGVALLKNIIFRKFARLDVAEARAKQCISCKYNVFPDKDLFLEWSDNIAIMQVGERKVSVHEQLASCDVCTCNLRSKVFFDGKLDKFKDDEVVKLKSVKCWQLELSGQ